MMFYGQTQIYLKKRHVRLGSWESLGRSWRSNCFQLLSSQQHISNGPLQGLNKKNMSSSKTNQTTAKYVVNCSMEHVTLSAFVVSIDAPVERNSKQL